MKFRGPEISIRFGEGVGKEPEKKIQILRLGTFYLTSDPSSKIEINSPMLESMVKNFSDRVRGVDLAIDYKHESDDIAAGWIRSLSLENNGSELWAEVDWTPNGRRVLAEKEFRYVSADFHLNYRNNETNQTYGPTLLGAGLTNRPTIKDMEPVVLLTESKGKGSMDEKEFKAKLDEKDSQIAAHIKEIQDLKGKIGQDVQKDPDGDEALEKKKMEEYMAENARMKKELDDMKAASAKAEEDKKLAEKKSKFDKLLSEGKAVEAQRQSWMDGDVVKFSELAGHPNFTAQGNAGDPPPSEADGAEAEVIKLAEKKVADNEAKDISDAIPKVLRENKDLRAKYESKFQ